MAKDVKKINHESSEGFSLLDVMIGLFIIVAIGFVAIGILHKRMSGVVDKSVVQEGESRTEEAISSLTAIAPDLTVGGTFEVLEDNKIRITDDCTDQTCDWILYPDAPENQRVSPAKGYPYSSAIPEGSQVVFLRRWRVDRTDEDYNLVKITVALLKSPEDTQTVVLEDAFEPITR